MISYQAGNSSSAARMPDELWLLAAELSKNEYHESTLSAVKALLLKEGNSQTASASVDDSEARPVREESEHKRWMTREEKDEKPAPKPAPELGACALPSFAAVQQLIRSNLVPESASVPLRNGDVFAIWLLDCLQDATTQSAMFRNSCRKLTPLAISGCGLEFLRLFEAVAKACKLLNGGFFRWN